MKNEISDKDLEGLLFEYMPKANRLLNQLEEERDKNEEIHVFSDSYKKNMKKIIKKYSPTPFQNKLLKLGKHAIVVLIFIILINGILITTVEGYRQRAFKIITNIYEKFTSLVIEVEEPIDIENLELYFIEPTYIPDGFQLMDDFKTDITRTIDYRNEDKIILFEQSIIINMGAMVDTEDTAIKEMVVNKQPIKYFFNKGMCNAYWNDDKYTYSLIAEVSSQDFTKIIEGIIKNKLK